MTALALTLCLFAAAAAATALTAVRAPSAKTARAANLAGCAGGALGCVAGLYAALSGSWEHTASLSLPWGLPVGACTLGLDPLSRLFLLPVFGLGLACTLSGWHSLRHEDPQRHNLGAHWFFFLLLLLGLTLVITARDAIFFLLSWELMSLAPFFLIAFNDRDRKARDASWVYLVAAHLGAVALMALFVLLWQSSGVTSLDAPHEATALREALLHPGVSTTLFVLALLGFGAKAGIAPLHVWLPEAHPAAPSHVSALLSGAMINAGLYGLLRCLGLLTSFGQPPEWWGWVLVALGIVTALMGILKAMAQSNLKRLLAYSSVENMGLMFMGAGAGLVGQACGNAWIALLGFAGMLMHMLNHSAFKGLLFLCAGEILHATGTVRMEQLGGLQKRLPLLGAAFFLGAASIACLPPFNGFSGELVLALALLNGPDLIGIERQAGLLLSLACLALVSGLAATLYAKAYGISFLGEARTGFAANARPLSWQVLWPLALPVGACIVGALGAPWLFTLTADTAQGILRLPESLTPDILASRSRIEDSLRAVVIVGMAGLTLTVGLTCLRARLLRQRPPARATTWGCGYQESSPRVQYTDAAFSEPLAKIFAPVMGLRTQLRLDEKLFPKPGLLVVTAPDRLRTGLFAPLFESVENICNACKIIQHGKIHIYILYILATLVGLLVWSLHA